MSIAHCLRKCLELPAGGERLAFGASRDTQSDWANPFKEGKHGDHATVVAAYRDYLEHSPGLKARLGEIRGKVLGCWCHPLPCHGDVLCEAAE
jgi:hypothetical protein